MTVTVDCAINSTPSTLLSTIALQGRTGDWEDELVIRKSEGKFQVIREHQHPLYRFITRIVSCVTNFFEMYKDKVKPNQHNENYGHGKERYDAMEEIFNKNEGKITNKVAWDALKAAS